MASTAMINQPTRNLGVVSKRREKEKLARRRTASAPRHDGPAPRRRCGRGACRPTARFRPRSRARRTRPTHRRSFPRCRPTSSPIACAPPVTPPREILLELEHAVRGRHHDRRARSHLPRRVHRARRLPEPAALQGLPEVAVHLGERSDLPRHPRRPRVARRRHRQLRRHDLPARCARRLQRHVLASATSTTTGRSLVRVTEESLWKGIDAGAPGRTAQRDRPRDPDARRSRRILGGARVRRARTRRGVPHRAGGAALLRPARRSRHRRRA